MLESCGIEDVVIVHAGTIPAPPAGARLVENPFDTSVTGSTLSLLCALRLGDPSPDHGLLIMDGDIVYEQRAMQFIVDRSTESTLFVAPERRPETTRRCGCTGAETPGRRSSARRSRHR